MPITSLSKFLKFVWVFVLLYAGSTSLKAQLILKSLPTQTSYQAKPVQSTNSRANGTAAEVLDTLSLPFWDDFAKSQNVPNPNLWRNSANVFVGNGLAIRPPSYNAATFDGTDAFGNAYKPNAPRDNGMADSLISQAIDLSTSSIAEAERGSVYLSFFWQLQGMGERPENRDSLKLYFYGADKAWHQVWSQGSQGEIDSSAFHQVLISVQDAQNKINNKTTFFHPGFQFKFQAHIRLSGAFDNFHIDYVYLDKGRSATDYYYNDYTISEPPTSVFAPYTAIPIHQFFANPQAYINQNFSFGAFSLNKPGDLGNVAAVTYTLTFNDTNDNLIYEGDKDVVIVNDVNFPLSGQEYATVKPTPLVPENIAPFQGQDSLYLKTNIVLNTDDERFVNDTIETVHVLHNYFAYDDGSAELGAGLNGVGQRIAYEFNLEERDTLTHINFYFPFYKESSTNKIIDLKVWRRLASGTDGKDSLVYEQLNVSIAPSAGLNQFVSYQLNRPVILKPGMFYVGYEQRSNNYLALGFDKNTDSHQKIFVSTDKRNWQQIFTEQGSLMIRPVFTEKNITTGVEDDIFANLKIYPNPNNGKFVIESQAERIQVYTSTGRLIFDAEGSRQYTSYSLDLGNPVTGLYIVKIFNKNQVVSKKLIIQN